MGKVIERIIDLQLPDDRSFFLWGPRKVGKSYYLRHILRDNSKYEYIDLLKTQVFADYSTRPSLLSEKYSDLNKIIIIDEIQKLPVLLDEVHWLIENKGRQFILTGSSARKLKRTNANMLGGRAWRRELKPLTYLETSYQDLEKVVKSGLLPPHYLSINPLEDIRAYVADYLKEEIIAEATVRNVPAFSDFLRIAAITSAELLNYTNVARECGVSAKVIHSYFDILEDTLLGFRLRPYIKSPNRRMIETEKFYLFDVGLTNFLARRTPALGSPEFGKAFEHLILMELLAYQAYRQPELQITFWRTSNGQEVDFILNDRQVALEVKAKRLIHNQELNNLKILSEDGPIGHKLVVTLEESPRRVGDVEILPWQLFLERLWQNYYTG